VSQGLGKIGVLVALESAASDDVLAPFGRQLAMHIAAANPQYLDQSSVPAAALDRERASMRIRFCSIRSM
jgi:elongation factor Ts